jgi:endogenous inhibitor of DNA gyrase (YacG/DUF329 family)
MTPASGPTVAARRASVTRLRAHGQTITEIADELGCSFATVARDLKALGLPALERKRGAFVACPRCGTEHYRAPSQMHNRFCRECYLEHISHPPPPTDRTCRRCGKLLAFKSPKDAVGRGYYCGRKCYLADVQHGGFVTCPECGTEKYRSPSHMHKRFCSGKCYARDQLRQRIELYSGKTRRLCKLKWLPRPGRPRNDQRLDYEETLQKIRDTYEETHASERDLERLTGESRRMIRAALGRSL